MLAIAALAAGIAFVASSAAVAQVDDAADCADRFGFARNPVPVAKTSDGQQVLASVQWGYSPGLCYLVLDDAAVQTLRKNPPTGSQQATTTADRTAAERCHNAHNLFHGFARNPVPVAKTADGQQVLASVKWGYTNGLCYLVLDDAALKTLQTYAPVTTPTPGGQFTAVAVGSSHWCGLRVDQTIVCNGLYDDYPDIDQVIQPPAGPFTAMYANGLLTCGSRPDQTWVCWGEGEFVQSDLPAGQFTDLGVGWFHACVLRPDQTVTCGYFDLDVTRLNLEFGQDHAPGGQFTTISVGAFHACGLRPDQTITCWGYNAYGQAEPPAGQFTAVYAGDNTTCGLRVDQSIACWGDNGYGQAEPPSGQFTAVSVKSHGCGIRTNGTVVCWGHNASGEADAPAGQFIAVSLGGGRSCAIEADRTAYVCWGSVSLLGPTEPIRITAN